MGNYGRDNRGGGGRSFGGRNSGGRSDYGRGGSRGGDRQMHSATCDNCGKDCQVPFRPTTGKPVYCSDCFEKMGGRQDSPRPQRRDSNATSNNNAQLEAISNKLDEIIKLLKPQVVEKEEKVVEEEKPVKVKKTKASKTKKTSTKKA